MAASDPIYTLEPSRLTPGEQVLAQTLQGLVARQGPRIWLRAGGVQTEIAKELQPRMRPAAGAWELVGQFRNEVKGAVVYKLGTPSLNVAASLCGVLDAVAVDESMLEAAKTAGLPVLADARGMTDQTAWAKYRGSFAKGYVVEQSLNKPGHLRDFAVKYRAFVMDTDDREFRKRVIRESGRIRWSLVGGGTSTTGFPT